MSNTLIRDALILSAVCVFGAYHLTGKADELEARAAEAETAVPTPQAERFPVQRDTGGTLTLYKERGQFYSEGYAQSARVRFLVDTGASVVALRLEDAEAAGFRRHELNYTATVSTANGTTRAAPVTLRRLSVGPITEKNVRALVLEDGLAVSLLGMSFLERLQSFEANRDTMTLRL